MTSYINERESKKKGSFKVRSSELIRAVKNGTHRYRNEIAENKVMVYARRIDQRNDSFGKG